MASMIALNMVAPIIGDRSLSDHAYVTVECKCKREERQNRVWHLNNLLKSEGMYELVPKEIS